MPPSYALRQWSVSATTGSFFWKTPPHLPNLTAFHVTSFIPIYDFNHDYLSKTSLLHAFIKPQAYSPQYLTVLSFYRVFWGRCDYLNNIYPTTRLQVPRIQDPLGLSCQ